MAKTKESNKEVYSNKVNLTVKIDKDLLRKIRVAAAEKGTSISALVADFIQEKSSCRLRKPPDALSSIPKS